MVLPKNSFLHKCKLSCSDVTMDILKVFVQTICQVGGGAGVPQEAADLGPAQVTSGAAIIYIPFSSVGCKMYAAAGRL